VDGDQRVRQDNERRDDRRRDINPSEDRHEERDLPPLPETGKRSINMIVSGLKSNTNKRRYRKDSREVKLIHTKPSQPLRWSE
jgi:hypothetical protein